MQCCFLGFVFFEAERAFRVKQREHLFLLNNNVCMYPQPRILMKHYLILLNTALLTTPFTSILEKNMLQTINFILQVSKQDNSLT